MLDNNTVVIYGWKVDGDIKSDFQQELYDFDEDYFDKYQDIFVEDTMCGDYIYFGAILAQYDAEEGGEVIINSKLIDKATSRYNKIIKDNPELDKILNEYKEGEPQLYVFQNIW